MSMVKALLTIILVLCISLELHSQEITEESTFNKISQDSSSTLQSSINNTPSVTPYFTTDQTTSSTRNTYIARLNSDFTTDNTTLTTTPDFSQTTTLAPACSDVTPNIVNVRTGKNWISFEWQIMEQSCRNLTTGIWVTVNSYPPTFCPGDAANNTFVTFNTSSSCFGEILLPCNEYLFDIAVEYNGMKMENTTFIKDMTVPGNDISAKSLSHDYGADWLSVEWSSSIPECQKFIFEYDVSLTNSFGSPTRKTLTRSCSLKGIEKLVFNSSLPCAQLTVYPCSNYSISLTPKFKVKNYTYFGNPLTIRKIDTKSGTYGEIGKASIIDRSNNYFVLSWETPQCASNASLQQYNVTIAPGWSVAPKELAEEKTLIIKPECLQKSNGMLILKISDETCASQGYKFLSCSPYILTVKPVYEMMSANEDINGWKITTQTLPLKNEALVANLSVSDTGSQWISLAWPKPICRVSVMKWIISELFSNSTTQLVPDCSTLVDDSYYILNISNSMNCMGNTIFRPSVIPCTNYSFIVNVQYEGLEVYSGNNNVALVRTDDENPGNVRDLNWNGNLSSVYLSWYVPEKNPQCVELYEIDWKNQKATTRDTFFILDNLTPCSKFLVTVSTSGPISHRRTSPTLKQSDLKVQFETERVTVSTSASDPHPVESEISVSILDGSNANISWRKPNEDYCITGYYVFISDDKSDVVFNDNVRGKDSTSLVLNNRSTEEIYFVSVSSFSNFSGEMSYSTPTEVHEFSWNTSSYMIKTAGIIFAVVFPILICAVLYAVRVVRKNIDASASFEYNTKLDEVMSVDTNVPHVLENGRRKLQINELESAIKKLEVDSCYWLGREFDELIPLSNSPTKTYVTARLEGNRLKNRYTNVIPYDQNRVKLKNQPPLSDYINASTVKGFAGNRMYIATQGPTQTTIEDFWQMCFEQDVKLIVMLTSLEEKGKEKCTQYWPSSPVPSSSANVNYGNMRVEFNREYSDGFHTFRDFTLRKITTIAEEPPKFARQIHFTQWPDFGCPENPETLVNLVALMRNENSYLCKAFGINSPIVVHCSAGIGRTGTLIALDILMEQAHRKRAIDVANTVIKIRKDRGKMVQTEEQYLFIYKCIQVYVQKALLQDAPAQVTDSQ